MKKRLFFITLFLFFVQHVVAQNLSKGKIIVVGVNVENNNCSEGGDYDKIYLVNLEDIENGYIFSLTDNRYDKSKDMLLENEGIYTFERVGGLINKGTVIKLDIIESIKKNDVINGWKLVRRNRTFNLSGSGDQFFVIEGNSWNIKNNNVMLNKDNIISAYNSLNNWSSKIDNNSSSLPESENDLRNITKHHFTPKDKNKKYRFYDGKTTPTSKNEWLIRLLNPDNWLSFDGCNQFVTHSNKVEYKKFTVIDNITKEACVNVPFILEVESDVDTTTNRISIQVNYEWFKTSTPTNTGGILIGTSRQINHTETIAGTYYYYCKITYQLNWKNNGSDDSSLNTVNSGYIKVTVNQTKTSPILNFSE
ncbi:hypothetical protein OBK20_06500 [Empedobacter falsenii]